MSLYIYILAIIYNLYISLVYHVVPECANVVSLYLYLFLITFLGLFSCVCLFCPILIC